MEIVTAWGHVCPRAQLWAAPDARAAVRVEFQAGREEKQFVRAGSSGDRRCLGSRDSSHAAQRRRLGGSGSNSGTAVHEGPRRRAGAGRRGGGGVARRQCRPVWSWPRRVRATQCPARRVPRPARAPCVFGGGTARVRAGIAHGPGGPSADSRGTRARPRRRCCREPHPSPAPGFPGRPPAA